MMTNPDHPRHLRHCMVVFAAYPYYETRVQREAEALVSAGYSVDVICPRFRDDLLIESHNGVTIHRVKMRWGRKKNLSGQFRQYLTFFWLATLKLNALHFKYHYDVVQAHNIPDFLVFVALIPKLTGARVIIDLHDLMPEFYQGRFKQSSSRWLQRLIFLQERWSCRFADHVITVTKHWRETLIRRGVPPEKCSVVMNLADTRIFQPLIAEEAAAKNKDQFCLFYHGDMPERYGLDLVLRAVNQLRDQIPGLRFVLVGGGQYLAALKQLARDLALDDTHVEFVGGIPAEELHGQIAQADVAVVPYRNDVFTDALLPTKLLEYAVVGLPTIAAKTTAISAYFDDRMVEFFQPGDVDDLARCILMLYTHPERRMQLSEGIREFNRQYNWTMSAEEYVATVERLGSKKALDRR